MGMELTTITFEEALEKHGAFVFPNVGRSMMPLLREGRDLVEIRKKTSERCKKYDVVLYRQNGIYVLHRILKVREKDYVLAGDHNCTKEYGITDEQIIGVLTAVIRDGKQIPVTAPAYLAYTHLWCDLYPLRVMILTGKRYLSQIIR